MKISIVVPCYNEAEVITETNQRLNSVLSAHFTQYEILYINDGSQDNTKAKILELKDHFPQIKLIDLSRNFGHQPAVSAGIKFAQGDYIIIIDADLQDPPELIPDMVSMAQSMSANVVYAVRESRQGDTWFKKITAKYFYRIVNALSETKLPLDTGDFRLIDRKVADVFNQIEEKQKYIRGLISWIGFYQVPIKYHREERFAGSSHYPLSKMIQFAMRGMLYFSKKPLTLATNIGLILVLISVLLLIAQFVKWIFFPATFVLGWLSIYGAIVFFGGIQLLTIGILGAYIGSIFDEIKNRPEYIVNQVI
ncbi:MAG: glycosyltransferase family 2 protein [Chitinophagales bacterium]|jgi:dolichol-phosphate mannosyltransferase|nr:glycosyltransferase family 2 protein [Chitinophagales bacterium]